MLPAPRAIGAGPLSSCTPAFPLRGRFSPRASRREADTRSDHGSSRLLPFVLQSLRHPLGRAKRGPMTGSASNPESRDSRVKKEDESVSQKTASLTLEALARFRNVVSNSEQERDLGPHRRPPAPCVSSVLTAAGVADPVPTRRSAWRPFRSIMLIIFSFTTTQWRTAGKSRGISTSSERPTLVEAKRPMSPVGRYERHVVLIEGGPLRIRWRFGLSMRGKGSLRW